MPKHTIITDHAPDTQTHRHDSCGYFAQEVSVVGDSNDSTLKLHEGFFQHLLGGDVQVVGGFIKHQESAMCQHEFGQCQASLFTSTQDIDLQCDRP